MPVCLRFPGKAAANRAASFLLTADRIAANNEWGVGEPQVRIRQEKLRDVASGATVTVPAHSLMALKWRSQ